MRTTLTLDDDVAKLLAREAEKRKTSLKSVVNEAIRRGLAGSTPARTGRRPFRTQTMNLGPARITIDNVWETIAASEGDAYR